MLSGLRWAPPIPVAATAVEVVVWLAGAVGAVTMLWRSPLGRPVRWVWARLVTEPRAERRKREITAAVRPLINEVKAAARQQHDDQNQILAAQTEILEGHAERLDRGADAINALRQDVAELRGAVGLPRDPNARERATDPGRDL